MQTLLKDLLNCADIADEALNVGAGMENCDKKWDTREVVSYIRSLQAKLEASERENAKKANEAIDKLYAKMCELDTPKRGELRAFLTLLLP